MMTHRAAHDPIDKLEQLEHVRLLRDEPLAAHTTMGVGGPARWLALVEEPAALAAAIKLITNSQMPWMVLGGGSNTIFSDEGWPGVVVKLGRGFRRIEAGPGPNQVSAGAAATLSAVGNFARRQGLAGLEWAAGVPGQLGGALAGNAGAGRGDICSDVVAVEVLSREGEPARLGREGFSYGYRSSSLRDWLILSATLQLEPDDPEAIRARVDAALAKRREQPLGERSSGCMFKNPAGDFAGRLIDQAGLKGLRVGGARVSEEHANFMINDGSATAADIEELARQVRERVRQQSGRELELEIRLIRPS